MRGTGESKNMIACIKETKSDCSTASKSPKENGIASSSASLQYSSEALMKLQSDPQKCREYKIHYSDGKSMQEKGYGRCRHCLQPQKQNLNE